MGIRKYEVNNGTEGPSASTRRMENRDEHDVAVGQGLVMGNTSDRTGRRSYSGWLRTEGQRPARALASEVPLQSMLISGIDMKCTGVRQTVAYAPTVIRRGAKPNAWREGKALESGI